MGSIDQTIYRLSWNEKSLIATLQLLSKSYEKTWQARTAINLDLRAHGYSALSSTYHTIYGRAFAHLKAIFKPRWLWLAPIRLPLWCVTWLPLGGWCYWKALPLSNYVVALIGYEEMTADMCDIRQSILRRRRRYDEAEHCINVALEKKPEKAHTRGLLHVGLADVYVHLSGHRHDVDDEVRAALKEAREAETYDPRQASRIYRDCAHFKFLLEGKDSPSGRQLQGKAMSLARETGAKDQTLKAAS